MKKFILFSVSLIIMFCLFFSIFVYADQTATTQDGKEVLLKSNGTWEYTKNQSQESYTIFQIGTTININDFQFCLNSTRWSKGSDLSSPKPDHIWLLLDCTIKNMGNEPLTISSMLMFDLKDRDGYSQESVIFADTKGTLDGELSPKQIMRGEIAFEVETDQISWEFIFKPDLINPGQAIYSILKEQIK